MPNKTIHVAPEVFLTHRGVTIWHAYEDADIEQPFEYWFSVSEDEPEEHYSVRSPIFDARELPTYRPTHPPLMNRSFPNPNLRAEWRAWHQTRGPEADAREAIIAAIEQGLIRQDSRFRYGKLPVEVVS